MVVFSLLVALTAASVVAAQSPAYGQCGGQTWTGATTCVSGYTCVYSNPYYSQCLPGTASTTTTKPSSTTQPTSTSKTTSTTKTSSTTPPSTTSSPSTGVIGTNFEGTVDSSVWGIIATAQSGGSATIDTTKAKSGTHSLKVVSTGGYSNHVFYGLKSLSALGSGDIYGRYYANFLTGFTQDHTTHMMMTDPSAVTLRMGGQFGVLNWNRASDDSIMPDGSPTSIAGSVAIAANTWYCIEFHLSRSTGQIETWVNGNVVPALTTPQTRWGTSYKPNPSDWGLGWESYGGAANTVWYDDIALGNSRIGC